MELDSIVAELRGTVLAEARHINERLDRQDARTEAYHQQNLAARAHDVHEINVKLQALTVKVGETNGQLINHRARLDEGDKNFEALWRRIEGLGRAVARSGRDVAHAVRDSQPFITKERAAIFAGGMTALWLLIEVIEYVKRLAS